MAGHAFKAAQVASVLLQLLWCGAVNARFLAVMLFTKLRAFRPAEHVAEGIVFAGGGADTPTRAAPLKLDVYHFGDDGSEAAERPVVVVHHGGAFEFGDRGEYRAFGLAVRRATAAVVVVFDYRKVPSTSVAEILLDVRAAHAWVAGNVHRYGGDRSRVVAVGHSAGAHLAAAHTIYGALDAAGVAAAPTDATEPGFGHLYREVPPHYRAAGVPPPVNPSPAALLLGSKAAQPPLFRAVLLLSGVHDLPRHQGVWAMQGGNGMHALGAGVAGHWAALSPTRLLSAIAAADGAEGLQAAAKAIADVDFFVSHGDADCLVDVNQSEGFVEALNAVRAAAARGGPPPPAVAVNRAHRGHADPVFGLLTSDAHATVRQLQVLVAAVA
jgi:acetyl esterase/lipase